MTALKAAMSTEMLTPGLCYNGSLPDTDVGGGVHTPTGRFAEGVVPSLAVSV